MVKEKAFKTILSSAKNPYSWFGADYNVNIYRGCSHGCIYCDSRSSCYGVENFDQVSIKKDALNILEKELAKKRSKGIISTGAMSDPYNPLEKDLLLTKGFLDLALKYRFGVCIATKSTLVLRDVYELMMIQGYAPVVVIFTITTFDDELCRKIEPNVAVTSERLKAMETLSKFGITTGVLLMPILPFINDTDDNIKNIVEASAKSGASFIYPSFGVTLRGNQKEYFYSKLEKSFPSELLKYQKYCHKYAFNSYNKRLYPIFIEQCHKYNLKYKMKDIISLYKETINYHQINLDEYWS